MLAVKVHTPTFLVERDIDRLKGKLPPATVERLRTSLEQFRSWVAQPALRQQDADAALQHIIGPSVVVAVQFKLAILEALNEADGGLDLFVSVVTEEMEVDAGKTSSDLAEAFDFLVSGIRTWLRFLTVHPDVDADQLGGVQQVTRTTNLGFTVDNVMTVCLMGFAGECGEVEPGVLSRLAVHAKHLAIAYYSAVQDMVEGIAPSVDAADPFRKTTLQDLLDLPPFDGDTVTVEEMDEAIRARFEPS